MTTPLVAYLALRTGEPKGFWHRVFSRLTRLRLVTGFDHGGIVLERGNARRLLDVNLARGLDSVPFDAVGWVLIPLNASTGMQAEKLFLAHKGAEYDWFSLLAFVLPWRVRDASRLYCFEWCWLAMTGENPDFKVTPEALILKAIDLLP